MAYLASLDPRLARSVLAGSGDRVDHHGIRALSPIQGLLGLLLLGVIVAVASAALFGLDADEWMLAAFFAVVVIGVQWVLGIFLAGTLAH